MKNSAVAADEPIAARFAPACRNGMAAHLAGIPVAGGATALRRALASAVAAPGGAWRPRAGWRKRTNCGHTALKKGKGPAHFYANPLINWLPEVGSNH